MEMTTTCMYDKTALRLDKCARTGVAQKTYYIFVRELFLKFEMCKACKKRWRVGVGGW